MPLAETRCPREETSGQPPMNAALLHARIAAEKVSRANVVADLAYARSQEAHRWLVAIRRGERPPELQAKLRRSRRLHSFERRRRQAPIGPADSRQVETIQVHDLVPSGHEVADELLLTVRACIDFGQGPELGV